jgi:HEAT repeat protein
LLYQPLPRTLDAALRDVGDPKPLVRVSAVRDLVRHGSEARERVIPALEKALGDANALVRANAAEALGDLEATDSIAALLIAVEDEHQLVRQKAIAALGEAKDTRAQTRLERALGDPRPEVRFQAVIAYPRVTTSREDALRAVLSATRDEDEAVAHIAFRMAEEIAGAGEGSEAEPALLARARECLKHASPRVRAVAAVVLGGAGDEAADPVLIAIVSGDLKTPETEDVAAAIELCADRKLEAARPALKKRATRGVFGVGKDDLWWHARTALARLGDREAESAILSDLKALSFERRTLAVSAVGRARLKAGRAVLEAMRGRPDRADPGAVDAALAAFES